CQETPHCVELPDGLKAGDKLKIQGSVPKDSVSFMVNFLCGKEENTDNALLVLVKLEAPSVVVLNSFLNKTLGEKDKYTNVPFARGQDFELEFVVEEDIYKVWKGLGFMLNHRNNIA
uniref:Galectin n=1 Tax=Varanus komodoensis TaxID=61221 RepID=A0A8D2J843_VARKO